MDFGAKTVGVALSDPSGLIASPLETIQRAEEENLKATIRRICQLVREYEVSAVVLGLPKNMNDTLGPRAEKTQAFQKRLNRDLYQVEVILWDERLSTRAAESVLLMADMGDRRQRKQYVDKMAAAYILQGYLDSLHNKNQNEKGNDRMEEEIKVITLYDPEEQACIEMEVIVEMEYDGGTYLLVSEFDDEMEMEDEDELDEEEEDEDSNTAYIFKVCPEADSEYKVMADDEDEYFVTTALTEEEFQSVAQKFMESEDYDLEEEDE